MAIAARAQGIDRNVIAIIGDGGMSAGMAFEALNHGGTLEENLLVILNDNEMSISPNVGGMSKYLSRIWSGKFYSQMRAGSKKCYPTFRTHGSLLDGQRNTLKGWFYPALCLKNWVFPILARSMATIFAVWLNFWKI